MADEFYRGNMAPIDPRRRRRLGGAHTVRKMLREAAATPFRNTPTQIGGTVGSGLGGGGDVTNFLALSDTPATYVGQSLKGVRVNTGETALEFFTPTTSFLGLTDTPSSYTGHAGKIVVVNSVPDALEFVALSSIDHGSLGGLTDDDHTQYLLISGTRAMTGDLQMLGHSIKFTGITAPSAPVSGVLLFDLTTNNRLHQLSVGGYQADLTIQNTTTLQGNWLGRSNVSETWTYDKTQTDTCTVYGSLEYSFNFGTYTRTTGYGKWDWNASRDQFAINFAQAQFATGGNCDYNGCNVIKLRAKVRVYTTVVSGSAPSGTYWDFVKFYLDDNTGTNTTLSADIQSQLGSSGSWAILEATFDISSGGLNWGLGADDGLCFGIIFKGEDVDDPDPDPTNEWAYEVHIEWIEAIQWVK